MVGNDGLVGVASFMGGASTLNRAIVRNAGRMVRMPAKILKDEFMRGGRFQSLLLLYTQSLITQISQTAVCNRLHSVDQRFCRWLLQSYDRLESSKLIMTQELIANMLGVRREGISHAAKRLQNMGVIRYVRGGITILDRQGLEENACECYQVIEGEYQRLIDRFVSVVEAD